MFVLHILVDTVLGSQETQGSLQIAHTKSLTLRAKMAKLMQKNREKVLDGILFLASQIWL